MKSFKQLMSEVAQPKSQDELEFKDKHMVTTKDYPVPGTEHQFKADMPKATRKAADYRKGEDMAVYEAQLDPVGQEDDDINNDGKVDSADRYLHRRRRAISKAIKNESAEELDEAGGLSAAIKRAEASRQKALKKAASMVKKGFSHEVAAKNHDVKVDDLKRHMKEAAELNELSPSTLQAYASAALQDKKKDRWKSASKAMDKAARKDVADRHFLKYGKEPKNESVEDLDEYKNWEIQHPLKPTQKYHVKARTTGEAIRKGHKAAISAGHLQSNVPDTVFKSKHIKKLGENLDESFKKGVMVVHPKTGATGKVVNVSGDKSTVDVRWTKKGYTTTHTIDDLELMKESTLNEISKKTLGSYIKKAKTDVAGQAYQLGARDPLKPKASWSKALGRERYIDKAVDRLTKEEIELDESNQMAAIGRKLQKMAPTEKNDMISNAMANLGDHLETYGTTFGARNMKELERKTGLTAKVIKMLIQRAGGSVNESVNLTENFKTGSLTLNDGSRVIVSKQNADLLNQMFNDLNPANRREMMKVAMKDKDGFNEILGFAREAL